jgi:tetratricopeptide (TPR) repeat protein
MLSVILAAITAAALFVAGFVLFDVISAVFMGLVGGGVVMFFLVRRVVRKVEASGKEVEAHLKAQRVDKAIAALEALRPLARWQPMLLGAIEGQIGVMLYAHKRAFDQARPHLARSSRRLWHAWAMLGAAESKRKSWPEMEAAFEKGVKSNRKESLMWASYAWCQWKRGEKTKAQDVLRRGLEKLPADQRLKAIQSSIEKGKKPKMSNYGPEWMALHLESGGPMAAAGQQQRYMPPPHELRRHGIRLRGR